MKDTLFLLKAPFEDGPGQTWFCRDCATMEGALLANPDWKRKISVRRVAFARPRAEVVELLGEEHQALPALVMPLERAPEAATRVRGLVGLLTEPKAIAAYLAATYGGAGPHP